MQESASYLNPLQVREDDESEERSSYVDPGAPADQPATKKPKKRLKQTPAKFGQQPRSALALCRVCGMPTFSDQRYGARGMCPGCYKKWRSGSLTTVPAGEKEHPQCSFMDENGVQCTRKNFENGYCQSHGTRLRRLAKRAGLSTPDYIKQYGRAIPTDPLQQHTPQPALCQAPVPGGCDREADAGGLCTGHRYRQAHDKPMDTALQDPYPKGGLGQKPPCATEGCRNQARSHTSGSTCNTCYQRSRQQRATRMTAQAPDPTPPGPVSPAASLPAPQMDDRRTRENTSYINPLLWVREDGQLLTRR